MTGKTVPADYDAENDKLVVSVDADIQYNPATKASSLREESSLRLNE